MPRKYLEKHKHLNNLFTPPLNLQVLVLEEDRGSANLFTLHSNSFVLKKVILIPEQWFYSAYCKQLIKLSSE